MNEILPVEIVAIILNGVGYPQLTQCVCRVWRTLVADAVRYKVDLLSCAARDGYLNVLDWGYEQGCLMSTKIWESVLEHDDQTALAIINWAEAHKCPDDWTGDNIRNIVDNNRFIIAERLIPNRGASQVGYDIITAALSSDTWIEWLDWNKLTPDSNYYGVGEIMKHATLQAIMRFSNYNRTIIRDVAGITASAAANYGRLDVLRMLSEKHGYNASKYATTLIRHAISHSKLCLLKEILELYPQRLQDVDYAVCPCNSNLNTSKPTIEMMSYIKNELGENPFICTFNIDVSHDLQTFKWMIDNGYRPSYRDVGMSIASNSFGVLDYLYKYFPQTFRDFESADDHGITRNGWYNVRVESLKYVDVDKLWSCTTKLDMLATLRWSTDENWKVIEWFTSLGYTIENYNTHREILQAQRPDILLWLKLNSERRLPKLTRDALVEQFRLLRKK